MDIRNEDLFPASYIGHSEPDSTPSGWWRWPLVPIAAVAAALVASEAMTLFQWLSTMVRWGSTAGWYYGFLVPAFVCGAIGFAYAWASCATAPRRKVIAGTVMVTLLGLFVSMIGGLIWILPKFSTQDGIQTTIFLSIGMVGAVAAVMNARRTSSNSPPFSAATLPG